MQTKAKEHSIDLLFIRIHDLFNDLRKRPNENDLIQKRSRNMRTDTGESLQRGCGRILHLLNMVQRKSGYSIKRHRQI